MDAVTLIPKAGPSHNREFAEPFPISLQAKHGLLSHHTFITLSREVHFQ